ncbi:TPM domain-containing protein [Microbacterium sp. M28]|uniref:TPM domain-containing protein n=1 Tax=Microbacterium sp. M28 TaxID=2962064 RepID=UPI0021F3EFFB|nr:TPM domain-containing protein [Microbacterium sp. M28]UYO98250.1 TPM domain-containing protein [Microbacterium sp. M28]
MTIILGMIVAVFASGFLASSAVATPPVTLDAGFVTDEAGVLSASELDAANARLDTLSDASEGDLYVVIVDEFTDPSDNVEWADQTAIDNGLGADQYLLAIAVESRQYALSADGEGPLSDSQLDTITQAIEDRLRDGDWDGAIVAAADAFPGPSNAGWILLFVLIAAAVVVLIIWLVARAKKKARGAQPAVPDPNDPFSAVSDADLERQAGRALVEADDAITSSREELGFAVAQFGDESTAQFVQVVDQAKAKVAEAFALKQQLDDENEDSVEQRRAWHIRIIQFCTEADELLDANIETFEQLRKVEAEAPAALQRVQVRRSEAQTAVSGLPAALATLAAIYDAAALSTVAENPVQAAERLALADTEIAEAASLIADARTGEAAFSIRTAEQAVIQAEQLAAAVTTLGTNLAAIEDQAKALIAELEADLAAASQTPDPHGTIAPLIAGTRARVDEAKAALTAARRDPQRTVDTLTEANVQIDGVLAQVRDAAEQAQRAARALQQRLIQAQSQITAANDYILTRRGAIGATARTRLAEADATYREAVAAQTTDPAFALERATRAYNLASEAISAAEAEVQSWTPGNPFDTGYGTGYGGNYSRDSGIGGDILGGILGGLFAGGGGGGGGGSWSGGSSWRSSGGSSSRGHRPSSFGGGSRGASRGGRSRGGRF